ncbi:caspase domain-containing protein [Rhypophila decipiens]|uniref:Caspase domain-containing protein n=1 Tax=Rhypophila decipiens TaxID=261697 RepID=A0AAN7AZM9_9PEZI|nr:caspase domain-containing protein [Rhypophila decipiens]
MTTANVSKRALLIGSSYQGLVGPANDVMTMSETLRPHGFHITSCTDAMATRSGILSAWDTLIGECHEEDVVVIFYSGHGGEVTSSVPDNDIMTAAQRPARSQFIYPMDYDGDDASEPSSFSGILDLELSAYLQRTTDKTENVTIIFDCCYSGRICRLPLPGKDGTEPVPRGLPEVIYSDIQKHVTGLANAGKTPRVSDSNTTGNPHAVRIFAAVGTEQAWEDIDPTTGAVLGFLTKWLSRAISEASIHTAGLPGTAVTEWRPTWSRTMLGVREMVELDSHGMQHPAIDGPAHRFHFSTDAEPKGAETPFVLRMENGEPVLCAGSVAGVRSGDVFALVPLGSGGAGSINTHIGNATVIATSAFTSDVNVGNPDAARIGPGLLAFLSKVALSKMPVQALHHIPELEDQIRHSKYIRIASPNDPSTLCSIQGHEGKIALYSRDKVKLFETHLVWRDAVERLISAAENLARGHRILSIACHDEDERLRSNLQISLGTVVRHEKAGEIPVDGTGTLKQGDRIYLSLKNEGTRMVYASVFDVNVAGTVSFLPKNEDSDGIEVAPGKIRTIGGAKFRKMRALPVTWPAGIPADRPISEAFVIVVTNEPINLRFLETKDSPETRASLHAAKSHTEGPGQSRFLIRAVQLASGSSRDVHHDRESPDIRYDVLQIPFTLVPTTRTSENPDNSPGSGDHDAELLLQMPNGVPEGTILDPSSIVDASSNFSNDQPPWYTVCDHESEGLIGGMIRTIKHVPPFVWVVNEHADEITVVVSKYRPTRLLSAMGVDANTTGAGLNFETTAFTSPATQKTLEGYLSPTQSRDNPWETTSEATPMARFPLWTRSEGFGVISIFVGKERTLYIENDQIPLGATAYFRGKPDLAIRLYNGEWQSDRPGPVNL